MVERRSGRAVRQHRHRFIHLTVERGIEQLRIERGERFRRGAARAVPGEYRGAVEPVLEDGVPACVEGLPSMDPGLGEAFRIRCENPCITSSGVRRFATSPCSPGMVAECCA